MKASSESGEWATVIVRGIDLQQPLWVVRTRMLEPASLPSQTSGASLSWLIKDETRRLGFDAVGIARVEPSAHAAFLDQWLATGHHGEMEYLARADAVK